ncbi:hypothetical protein [Limosilactobacillus fermentum]
MKLTPAILTSRWFSTKLRQQNQLIQVNQRRQQSRLTQSINDANKAGSGWSNSGYEFCE